MKIKTEELEGVALDWAVAEALDKYCARRASDVGHAWGESDPLIVVPSDHNQWFWTLDEDGWSPSTLWQQGGPLIEQNIGLSMRYDDKGESERFYAEAWCGNTNAYANGPTPLIAGMRAIVTAKLGEEVDVPDDLIN